MTHPAIPEAAGYLLGTHSAHFVAEGWEDLDRGICACGHLVRWDHDREKWVANHELIALVLTPDEFQKIRDGLYIGEEIELLLDRQRALNEEIE